MHRDAGTHYAESFEGRSSNIPSVLANNGEQRHRGKGMEATL